MPQAIAIGILALGVLNLATFIVFGIDKRRAARAGRRIRERDLLLLALAGGTPGAFAARSFFRHKTRKQPFTRILRLIALFQAAALLLAAEPWTGLFQATRLAGV